MPTLCRTTTRSVDVQDSHPSTQGQPWKETKTRHQLISWASCESSLLELCWPLKNLEIFRTMVATAFLLGQNTIRIVYDKWFWVIIILFLATFNDRKKPTSPKRHWLLLESLTLLRLFWLPLRPSFNTNVDNICNSNNLHGYQMHKDIQYKHPS